MALGADEEKLRLDFAERDRDASWTMRSYGAGTQTKRGVYTAIGTLSLLQDGDPHIDLNMSDLRYLHAKLGRLVSRQYAESGSEDVARVAAFGEKGALMKKLFQTLRENRYGAHHVVES